MEDACKITVEKILKKKNDLHIMANEALAKQVIEELQKKEKSPVMVQVKGWQFIAVSKTAKRKLSRKIEEMRQQDLQEIEELNVQKQEVLNSM